jgi:rhamnosyltransferase
MTSHVLICSHNGERFIGEQIESILKQDARIDRVHVYDFASTDRTREAVTALANTHVNVSLKTFPDAPGASRSFFAAFNDLATKVGGDDIVFICDQDDVWLPGKAAAILQAFNDRSSRHANDLFFHDVTVVDANLNPLRKTYYTGNPFEIPRDLDAERILLANPIIGHTMAASAALLKNFCRDIRPEGFLMHDWALALYASREGAIHFVDRPLSLYRQHEANVLGAYGQRPLSAVIARTLSFATGLVTQTRTLAAQLFALRSESRSASDRRLLSARNSRFRTAWTLALMAVRTGPTLKRKCLFVFLLISAIGR